jgi:hypothetical protein
MTTHWNHGEELERIDVGGDFGNLVGPFVRLSVVRDDGGTEWVGLDPDEAETLATRLHEVAQLVRDARQRRGTVESG